MWRPILDSSGVQERDRKNRPKWICHTGGHRLNVDTPTVRCDCDEDPRQLSPECIHRLREVAKHGCCGGPITRIYGCLIRTSCTLGENDGTLEWKGEPVVSCKCCRQRSADEPNRQDAEPSAFL